MGTINIWLFYRNHLTSTAYPDIKRNLKLYFMNLSNYMLRNGEEWAALRKMLSEAMMKPINVKGFYPGFSSVALDALDSINTIKGQDGIIQNLRESVLGKWSLESMFLC